MKCIINIKSQPFIHRQYFLILGCLLLLGGCGEDPALYPERTESTEYDDNSFDDSLGDLAVDNDSLDVVLKGTCKRCGGDGECEIYSMLKDGTCRTDWFPCDCTKHP